MEGYLGQIILFAGNFAPRNWAFCQGQLLGVAQNQALFSILGTNYGGDGRTTFALPDLKSRTALGTGNGAGLKNVALGEKGGVLQSTVGLANLPNIPIKVSSGNATQNGPSTGASIATPGTTVGRAFTATQGFNTATPDTTLNPGTAGGNSIPMNTVSPFLGMNYIICISGLYPSRN